MGDIEEEQETANGQVYRNAVNAERTLEPVIIMEQVAPALQQELQTIRAEAAADRSTLQRIEQLILRSMGGGGWITTTSRVCTTPGASPGHPARWV